MYAILYYYTTHLFTLSPGMFTVIKSSHNLLSYNQRVLFFTLIALKPQFTLSCLVITLFPPYLYSVAKPFIIIFWGEFNVLRNQISYTTLSIWASVLLAAPLDWRHRQRQAWKWHHRHFFLYIVQILSLTVEFPTLVHWKISQTIWWFAMESGTDVHGPQRISRNDFGVGSEWNISV